MKGMVHIEPMAGLPVSVASFYRFVSIAHTGRCRERIKGALEDLDVTGTVLIATEGINATLAGSADTLASSIDAIAAIAETSFSEVNVTGARVTPFRHLEVRLRSEIVSLRNAEQPGPSDESQYVGVDRWHALLDDPDVLVVDVRNDYETRVGGFAGAFDPGTESFHDFPDRMTPVLAREKPAAVAMYCTGGIRCEKAAEWVRAQGVDDVYQLEGGILSYLRSQPADSRWRGECFVFDKRVSVTSALAPGDCIQCHNCRTALTADDRASPEYEAGVSCPYCASGIDEDNRRMLRERTRFITARADGPPET